MVGKGMEARVSVLVEPFLQIPATNAVSDLAKLAVELPVLASEKELES